MTEKDRVVTPIELRELTKRIRSMLSRRWLKNEIAVAAGTDRGTISRVMDGRAVFLRKSTYDKIMAVTLADLKRVRAEATERKRAGQRKSTEVRMNRQWTEAELGWLSTPDGMAEVEALRKASR